VPQPQLAVVRSVIDETEETKSLVLEPEAGHLDFVPGQFVNVTVEIPGKGRVRRAYSIASSPLDPDLELTVKKMEGGALSTWLCDAVKPGDVLQIRGPYGIFTLLDDAKDVVFIAAGSGIVPFRSMWRYIDQRRLDTRIALLYASKSLPYVIYRQELEELGQRHPVTHTLTRNTDPNWRGFSRRIDKAMLVDIAGNFSGKLVYVCGPPAMCDCVVGLLQDLNVPKTMIKTEKYD
jgi:ferredoxin-NADP reductase